ncbi:FecR family protein [Cyclobacterium lianum]|uniref:FecR family protein n=1 Tax=Cyclobacterium lianum TaxID=388280 RepID=A0A1M7P2M0_9BACT|nr:FecR domain-containing protein [Cyclobacterium lianum]SHN10255.1 FecR family protein [Cyclobacterium lianum]
MKSNKTKRNLISWLKGKPASDRALFIRKLFDHLAGYGAAPDVKQLRNSKRRVWKVLERHTSKQHSRRAWLRAIGRYAAVLLLAGFVGFCYWQLGLSGTEYPEMQVKQTQEGQRSAITLSDGSVVRLNQNSRFEFPESFSGDYRQVKLDGEAFFDIKANPEKPFVVQTGDAEVQVLGTSFNVNTDQATEVTVASGKVRVADKHSLDQEVLQPGQQAVLTGSDIAISEVNPDHFIGWHTRNLSFEEESVQRVFEILERAYGVSIQLRFSDQDPDCLITGSYQGERIEAILLGMKYLLEFDYETDKNAKTIYINNMKCK